MREEIKEEIKEALENKSEATQTYFWSFVALVEEYVARMNANNRDLELCFSETSKCLRGRGLYFLHSLLPCSVFLPQFSPLYPRSSVRALPSSWRTWRYATKCASFSVSGESVRN